MNGIDSRRIESVTNMRRFDIDAFKITMVFHIHTLCSIIWERDRGGILIHDEILWPGKNIHRCTMRSKTETDIEWIRWIRSNTTTIATASYDIYLHSVAVSRRCVISGHVTWQEERKREHMWRHNLQQNSNNNKEMSAPQTSYWARFYDIRRYDLSVNGALWRSG